MGSSIVVIGLGQVGTRLAERLASRGIDVVAIDRRRDMVEELRDGVALAVALDSTDESALKANLPENVRAAIVCIGGNFEATVLTTVLLKQLGVRRVIVRADSPVASRVLRKVGADETFNPEEESADRWANRIAAPRFLNQIEFHEGYSVVEVATPEPWVGKTLIELDLRGSLGVHMVALKRRRREPAADTPHRIEMPRPDDPLHADDILILMGKDEDLGKVPQSRGG
jgi:trk system potassium uptake protein TrkA